MTAQGSSGTRSLLKLQKGLAATIAPWLRRPLAHTLALQVAVVQPEKSQVAVHGQLNLSATAQIPLLLNEL